MTSIALVTITFFRERDRLKQTVLGFANDNTARLIKLMKSSYFVP